MACPPMRGVTNGYAFWKIPIYDKSDTRDWLAHFPAGDRNPKPGSGERSQRKAAGSRGWTLYEPTKPGFKFRSGPCGDWLRQNPGEHVKGGKYYNGGKIHKVYTEGRAIWFEIVVTTHHNGYSEFRVCDAAKCGGDITNECLRDSRKCVTLQRAWDKSCESRNDKLCGPIDPKYPHRWYHPCPYGKINYYKKIKYQLPKGFHCKHCVVQFYWTSANGCNPPGVWDYFTGPRGPKWGNCKGQGEAVGGYRRWPALCDGDRFAEEYYQCGDITIKPAQNSSPAKINPPPVNNPPPAPRPNPPAKSPTPSPRPAQKPSNSGSKKSVYPIKKVVLYADGASRIDVYDGQQVELDMRKYKWMTFDTKVFPNKVAKVIYFINEQRSWQDNYKPYVFNGNSGARYNYWWKAIYNKLIRVKVVVPVKENGRDVDKVMSFKLYLRR